MKHQFSQIMGHWGLGEKMMLKSENPECHSHETPAGRGLYSLRSSRSLAVAKDLC